MSKRPLGGLFMSKRPEGGPLCLEELWEVFDVQRRSFTPRRPLLCLEVLLGSVMSKRPEEGPLCLEEL